MTSSSSDALPIDFGPASLDGKMRGSVRSLFSKDIELRTIRRHPAVDMAFDSHPGPTLSLPLADGLQSQVDAVSSYLF